MMRSRVFPLPAALMPANTHHRLLSTAASCLTWINYIISDNIMWLKTGYLITKGFDNDGHEAWQPQTMTMTATNNDHDGHKPWWPKTQLGEICTTMSWIWRFLKSTPLVFRIFIAVAVMVFGIGPITNRQETLHTRCRVLCTSALNCCLQLTV